MKHNHPAAGLEFDNENLRPVDRHLKDKQMLFEALQSALDDYVFDGKCAKCNNRIYIKNGFVRQPPQDKDGRNDKQTR